MVEVDFSEFLDSESANKSDKLAQLCALVREYREAVVKVERAELVLTTAKSAVREIEEHKIPALMEELTIARIDLPDGLGIVTVDDEVHANISEERGPRAFNWLDENGHSGIVKNTVEVPINRGEDEKLDSLVTTLVTEHFDYRLRKAVAPQTLKKFARERLAEEKEALTAGEKPPDFPKELFGVFVKKVAKIKEKKS